MKYEEYLINITRLKNMVQAGIIATYELKKVVYEKDRIKLNKIIRRGKRAEEKLLAGVIK